MKVPWLPSTFLLLLAAACGTSSSSSGFSTPESGGEAGEYAGGGGETSDGGTSGSPGSGGEATVDASAGGQGQGGSSNTGGSTNGGSSSGGSGPGGSSTGGSNSTGGSGPGGSNGTGGSADVDAAVPPGPPETTKIKIIVEPGDYGAALLAAMNAATTSIHMTMYLLTSSNVQDALIKAKKRGVQVKVVLNQTFPPNTTSDNTSAYNTLTSAGIGVVWASSVFNYTHAKTVLIDSSQVWIMTMNATTSAPTYNREYLAVDTDPADVAEAEAIFAADYAKTSYAPSGKLVVAPDNARVILNEFIATAASSLDVEAEALSDSDIRDDLANKCASGVKVRVVIAQDDSPSASQTAALNAIKTAGCPVVVTSDPYIHAKTIVVDGVRAYVGSENFTTNSLTYNRELGVLVNNPTEVAKIVNVFNTDYANGTAQ